MYLFRNGITLLLLIGSYLLHGQDTGFDSFISRISGQYKVDVAIAPELIPILDSIRNVGPDISTVEELLKRLLIHSGITYQIMDGNKVMLRRENPADEKFVLMVLEGVILDAQTGEPIPYATVFVPHRNAACTTDENGKFILPLTDTTGEVQINFLGYKPLILPVNSFRNGSITLSMEIQKMPLEEVVVVVPYKLMDQDYSSQSTDLTGYKLISEDQILHWNAERLITSLTTYTHYSSEEGIRIRGSEEGNSLILMDEIPVYDPYHFYNIFSPFNGQYFSSIEIYKNNLPIEYGGRIDGMIDMQSARERPGTKAIFDTDLLLTSLTTEIKLSERAYLLAGGRISHTSMLNDALSDSTTTNFKQPGKYKNDNEWSTTQQPTSDFYDYNLGVSIQPATNSHLDLHFFNSRDQLDNTTSTDFETSSLNHETTQVHQTYTSEDVWKNIGASAEWKSALSTTAYMDIMTYYSGFDKTVNAASLFEEVRDGMLRQNTYSGFQQNAMSTLGIKGFVHSEAGYTAGVEIQHHKVDFKAKENNTSFLSQAQQETESTLFGEYRNRLWNKLDWAIGSRITYLQSTSEGYFLPNVRLNYTFDKSFSIRTAYSKNLQAVQELTLENRFGREMEYLILSEPEESYPILQSDKYMVGLGYASTSLSIDVEAYYKKMNGLASVRPLRPGPPGGGSDPPDDYYRLFTGDGWAAGMDVTILYKMKRIEASLLYSLGKIAERYDALFNGNYFSPQEDRRHQVKAALSYSFGKFRASTLLNYKSKAPYLSLIRLEGHDGIGMADQGNVYRYLPPYFTLDLGLDYSFTMLRQPAMLGVSLINATNHENINDLQHLGKVSREGGGFLYLTTQTELLGRTGNVHFRILIQ